MKKYFRWPLWLLLATIALAALVPALSLFHPSSSAAAHAEGTSTRPAQATSPTPPPLTIFRGRPLPVGRTGNELPRGWKPPIPTRFQPSHLIPKSGVGSFCNSPCSPPLTLYNSPNSSVLHHPHVMMIFWGPNWGDSTNKHYPTYVKIVNTEELLFKKLAGSHYNNLLTQYYGNGGQVVNDKNNPVFQGATLDQTAPPSGIDNNAEASEIVNAINANPNWANVPDGLFMLFPQEGSTYNDPSLSQACGYHFVTNDGNNHLYSMEPYLKDTPFTNCIGLTAYGANIVQAMTVVASHEYAEAVTDPWDNSSNTKAWLDTQKNNEIGDLCAPEHVALKELGGIMVQNLFDNFAYAHDHSQGCDTASGDEVWHYQTGGYVQSSPAVVNGVVYVGSQDAYVYALNASNGSLLWRYQTGNLDRSSPAVVKGVVYIGSLDYYVYAFKAF